MNRNTVFTFDLFYLFYSILIILFYSTPTNICLLSKDFCQNTYVNIYKHVFSNQCY